jgi:hypothetical protein
MFSSEMDSTSRRVNPFFEDVMNVIVGSNQTPLNFEKMISDGWLVLVNLDPNGVWSEEQQRLLGTLVVNEILDATTRLVRSGWKGRYYVYIDEFGKFATRKLADVLASQRKNGLSFTFGHQYFEQIDDRSVVAAVEHAAKIKVLFQTPGRDDRDRMIRMMYGGDVPDRQVSYELGDLKKKHAAIKINKQPPRITRLKEIPDTEISAEELTAFKDRIYTQPWYRSPEEVLNEINARFAQPEPARSFSKRPANKRTVEPSGEHGLKRKDNRSSKARAVFDNSPDSTAVLFSKKGRATRKVDKVPPETK